MNIAAYPQCARRLRFQNADLNDPLMNRYWAAVNVATSLSDTLLADFGGFNFDIVTDANGGKLLKRLEEFMAHRGQQAASSAFYASEGLKALLGARGVKTSMLKSENDYWTAAETLFPGKIDRNGGFVSLYVQIHSIPKKIRRSISKKRLWLLPRSWISAKVETV